MLITDKLYFACLLILLIGMLIVGDAVGKQYKFDKCIELYNTDIELQQHCDKFIITR